MRLCSLGLLGTLLLAAAAPAQEDRKKEAGRLTSQALALARVGKPEQAVPLLEQALAIRRELYPVDRYPNGDPELAYTLNYLGMILREIGAFEKAIPPLEESLAIWRKLFPPDRFPAGHRGLIVTLVNLGAVLREMGAPEKALPYFLEAAAVARKQFPPTRFPDGHIEFAMVLGFTGNLLHKQGDYARALPFLEESLDMARRLSKNPLLAQIPDLAAALNNLGNLLFDMGDYDKALPYLQEAVALHRRNFPPDRYPDGHLHLANGLENLALLLTARGELAAALPVQKEALEIERRQTFRLASNATEDEALAFARYMVLTRDLFLSIARAFPDRTAEAYLAVWDTKAAVVRVFEQRQAAARAAGARLSDQLIQLRTARRQIDLVLQDTQLPAADRERRLTELNRECDRLERELAAAVPVLARWKQQDRRGPRDLAAALPKTAILVDILANRHIAFDPEKPGKAGQSQTHSYVAFVVARGREVVRIDLGEAEPIDRAVLTWRQAIDAGKDERSAGEAVRAHIWDKIRGVMPAGVDTIYFAPDGDLTRLPWAALPLPGERVLIEDYSIATVPHAPFLLEQLAENRQRAGSGAVLAVGNVAYGTGRWRPLPGSGSEIEAIRGLTPGKTIVLREKDATAANVLAALPDVRFVHLATHGEFRNDELAAEKLRLDAAIENWHEGAGPRIMRKSARNPLGFVGLVLAGGEVLTGLSLIDRSLDHLELVTLSACETGLGAFTDGEGVFGLTRAIHLAGCPNVVASLWNVDDAAAPALMAKFYHELLTGRKPLITSLREAQLLILRRPDLISDLTGNRGAPRLKDALRIDAGSPPDAARPVRTPTRLWSAFVLSGAGR